MGEWKRGALEEGRIGQKNGREKRERREWERGKGKHRVEGEQMR